LPHFLWQDKETLILYCCIRAKASQNQIAGLFDGRLKIQITAAPVDGKANKHLRAYLAKEFGVAKSHITLLRGTSSRQKTLAIHKPKKIPPASLVI